MPAPKQNPALIAAAIALRVAKAAKAAKAAKTAKAAKNIAKKPVTKVQPKVNAKVANPKSNVKVVSSGKSPQQISAEKQYLRERNNAAVYTGKGKVQVPTSKKRNS